MTVTVTSTKQDIHKIKISVYGLAGVGKTVLCGTAPKPIILSAEAGLLSLANKDIPVIEIKSVKDLHEAYAYLKDNYMYYDTICLDSISDIAEQVLDSKMQALQKTADDTGKNMDPRQGYGSMAIEMRSLTKAFRSLPTNIVFTAKQGQVHDEMAKSLRFGPMLPGQMYTQAYPYYFDILCCLRVAKDGTRYLQTQPDLQYTAKDRSGKLETAERPNLTNLFEKVLSNV